MIGSALVPPTGTRWRCNKRSGRIVIGGVPFCAECGRRLRERYRWRPSLWKPEYVRTHVGMWGFWGAC